MGSGDIRYRVRETVRDEALGALHARAFGAKPGETIPWSERLDRWSLTWVTAWENNDLRGFVNVVGDGGAHAVLLDTVVDPTVQGRGVGRQIVATAAKEAGRLGCDWLHVDYEPQLADFYERVCGFHVSPAGLMCLR